MKTNYIAWLIGASALAILALIGFQVSWMQHSRKLLEEQFNNRVNMALCSTVERLAANPDHSDELRACCALANDSACSSNFEALLQQPGMQTALTEALHFYQIDLPYQLQITPKDSATAAPLYSCSLDPILENDTHLLQLEFKGKTEYFLHRMGFMVFASVAILLFICLVFALATMYLLRQKRLGDRNRDVFNTMAHEFRTPLTNIRLASNLLARRHEALAGNRYLDIIQRECGQLVHQVENVLQLGGLEKGEYQLQKEPVHLGQLAAEVVAGMDLQIRECDARVEIRQSEQACTIEGDPFHLGNAFRNLLDNALKYSGAQPVVRIDVQPEGSSWRVRFADNGGGLTPREQRKIFQKFHRCENALCSGKKGFGLGLAYVKKIVEMHRGHIAVSSPAGQGAHFDLYFPTVQ